MREYKPDCRNGEPMDSKKMVDLVLKSLNIDRDDPRLEMNFQWKDIVGPRYASHVRPVDIKNDVLFVKIDHPAWAQLFLMDQKKFLREIAKEFPSLGIKRIMIVSR